MRQLSLKLEPSVYEIVSRHAKEQDIKLTRYLRTLIEKGLVVDMQLHQKQPADLRDNSKTQFEVSMAEFQVATYALLKKYGEAILGSAENAQEEAFSAQQKAKLFVAKALGLDDDL